MSWIKIFLIQLFSIVFLFFVLDYVYTNYVRFKPIESTHVIRHDVYHHTLLPSFDGIIKFGNISYRMCTDGNGFRSDCKSVQNLKSNFDIAFIGDSFTEGIGMNYEDSFVGMFAASNRMLDIANLGVISYAPTVYRAKIQDYIARGYSFNHVIVFVDISDIQDESFYYTDRNGIVHFRGEEYSQTVKPIYPGYLWPIRKFVVDNFFLFTNTVRLVKRFFFKNKSMFNNPRSEWTYDNYSNAYGDLGVTGSINKAIHEMTLLYNFLRDRGIKLSVGVYPWPAQLNEMAKSNNEENQQVSIWQDFCINRCENFINVFPEYFRLIQESSVDNVYEKYFIPEDIHFNAEGNRLLAKLLLELKLNK